MSPVTKSELSRLSITELRGLWREMFNQLAASAPENAERRDALASLENIEAELRNRLVWARNDPT